MGVGKLEDAIVCALSLDSVPVELLSICINWLEAGGASNLRAGFQTIVACFGGLWGWVLRNGKIWGSERYQSFLLTLS